MFRITIDCGNSFSNAHVQDLCDQARGRLNRKDTILEDDEVTAGLHKLLQPFVLRRVKSEGIQAEPLATCSYLIIRGVRVCVVCVSVRLPVCLQCECLGLCTCVFEFRNPDASI